MTDKKVDVCISKPFTLKGFWFLPNDFEHRIAGILTYKPGETAKLELIGGFNGMDSPFDSLRKLASVSYEPIIFGITSLGKAVTLFDCNVSNASTNSNCPFPMETYSCSILLYGVYLSSRSESCICKSFVEIPAIDCFLRERPFDVTHYEDGSIEVKASPRSNDCENTVNINGFSFSLSNNAAWSTDFLNSAVFTSRPTLSINSDKPYSLDDHLRFSHLFVQFLMISSLSPTSCTRVSIDCKLDETDIIGEPTHQTAEVVYSHHAVYLKPQLHQSLLDYKTIKNEYPNIIRKWFDEDEKLGPIKSHLIEVIIDSSHYTSSQFLLMIQAIEGYYNRYVKDKEQLTVLLTNLIKKFDTVDRIANMNLNIIAIRDSRHYYSHFMASKPNTLYGSELAVATSQLRVLLICCMLQIMGFDNLRINTILNSCHNSLAQPLP